MTSHPAFSLYEPTAEEEAYAVYVFEKLFGNYPADGCIHLEAKSTLAILQKSGVDGLLLRTIWSVADPENSRCLTHTAQFHVVLRLIALAQDGLLEEEINRAFQQRQKTTPVAVLQKTLWMSSDYRDCPAPSFEGVPAPKKEFIRALSNRIRGLSASSSPAPATMPARNRAPAPVPAPAPLPAPAPSPPLTKVATRTGSVTSYDHPLIHVAKLKEPPSLRVELPPNRIQVPDNDTVPTVINVKKKSTKTHSIQSAIEQIETMGVDNNNPKVKDLKELDPDNFELLQEEAALQRAILESSSRPHTKAEKNTTSFSNNSEVLSEEQALQRAIYESTHAASPVRQTKTVAAAAQKKDGHQNWLRMTSFPDSESEYDKNGNDSDEDYKQKKAKKGDAAYAEYLASLDPPSEATAAVVNKGKTENTDGFSQNSEYDRKPPAKPAALKMTPIAKPEPDRARTTGTKTPTSSASDSRVDQYPQAVQELVMNGFELEKAIQGYKMLGDNFDDIVLFLTSNMTVKELVINGFNIQKVVKAYDLIGDNMDELLVYLMATKT